MRRLLGTSILLLWLNLLGYSQTPKQLVLQKSSYSIKSLFKELNNNYDLEFAFSNNVVNLKSTYIPSNSRISLEVLLKELAKQNNLDYEISGQTIYLRHRKKPESKLITISGIIKDKFNGEALIGAHVTIEGSTQGVTSNTYGFYSLSLPAGNYKLQATYTGYNDLSASVDLKANSKYDFVMEEQVSRLKEVVVTAREPDANVIDVIPGKNVLHFKSEGDIPYFLGEVDVLQGSLLLPGINNLGEDSNGINVRGGSADQNLILLDEATIYNASHFYGLISVFNPESVNDVEILKGSIPSQYGGRISSVINIRQKEGNNKEFHMAGGIGLVAARLTLEGPIKKDKSSFLIAGRRSILNLAIRNADFNNIGNNRANFEDFNFKVNLKPNEKNRLYVSGYYGNDRNETGFETFRRWGNRTLTFRWNRLLSEKLFSNFSVILSQYSYRVTDLREAGSFFGTSRIINYDTKLDFSYFLNPNNKFNFGSGTGLIRLNPGDRLPLPTSGSTNPVQLDTEHGFNSFLYANHETRVSRLKLAYGFRVSSLHNIGAGDVYIYDSEARSTDNIIDTVSYNTREVIKSYIGFEPRIAANIQLNSSMSIKASYNRNYQYLHLISNTISPAPTDIWKISDTYIKPTRADQYSIGLFKNFKNNEIETYVDFYYQDLNNILEYKTNADLLLNETIETEIISGTGRSYGLELMAKKSYGIFQGWISYSSSRTERKVQGPTPELTINDGRYFPANSDQTHQFSCTGLYSFSERLSGSANFIFSTGRPITLPSDKFEFNDIIIPHFTERNQDRLPNYHRLDLSLKLQGRKVKKNGKIKKRIDYWTFSVYNVYARKNAFSYLFRESEVNPGQTEIVKYSILPTAIPAITYNFRL